MSDRTLDRVLKEGTRKIAEWSKPNFRRNPTVYNNPCFPPPKLPHIRIPSSPIEASTSESVKQFQNLVKDSQQNEPQSEIAEFDIDFEISSSILMGLEESIRDEGIGYGTPVEDTASSLELIDQAISPLTESSVNRTLVYSPNRSQEISTSPPTLPLVEYIFPTLTPQPFESNAILTEYLRDAWNQNGHSVAERLEAYLTPIQGSIRNSTANSVHSDSSESSPPTELSLVPFLNYQNEIVNPFTL